eukprot:4142207-Amphidinium_carterae.1
MRSNRCRARRHRDPDINPHWVSMHKEQLRICMDSGPLTTGDPGAGSREPRAFCSRFCAGMW